MNRVMNEAFELVRKHSGEIAERMFAPSGQWFYLSPSGKFSDMLTSSTKFNPANFECGEWVLVFQCTQELDDIPAGEEVSSYEEWLFTDFLSNGLETAIVFPSGGNEE